jgi:hypothetical protein
MKRLLWAALVALIAVGAVHAGGDGQDIEGVWVTPSGTGALYDRQVLIVERVHRDEYVFIWYFPFGVEPHLYGSLSLDSESMAYVGDDDQGGRVWIYVAQVRGYSRACTIGFGDGENEVWLVPLSELLERDGIADE